MKPHPLQGVKAWHREPPPDWTRERIEGLQRPHSATAVTLDELRSHANYSYRTLVDIKHLIHEDMASLTPYRSRCAWRITRGLLFEQGLIRPTDSLAGVAPDVFTRVMPPPAPADLDGYDPTQDHELEMWISKIEQVIHEANLGAPTKADPYYGRNQTSSMLNPHFARAAWPSWFDLLSAEAAMVDEVTEQLSNGGPMGAKRHLHEHHNILGLEANATITLAANILAQAYDLLDKKSVKALYAYRIDDLIDRAKQECRMNAEIAAVKLGSMLHGVINEAQRDIQDDIMDSIVEPRDLNEASIAAIAPLGEDPLLLDTND